jgi:phage-related minor tail protein
MEKNDMANKNRIGAIIALDGEKEFRTAVSGVNKELGNLKSESALVKEQFEGQANTLEALKKKHEVLEKVLDAHKKKEDEIKKGLDHAKQSYDSVGKGLETIRAKYQEATEKMDKMKGSYDSTSKEMQNQEKELRELSDAIARGEKNYQSAGDRITDWKTKLNNAQVQTLKANKALEQNDIYMKEAQKSTEKCATTINEYGKVVKTTTEATLSWQTVLKGAIASKAVDGMTDVVKELGDASFGTAKEIVSSANQVQASTGMTTVAMSKYRDVMMDIYKNNFGQNFDDVGEAVSVITQNLGQLDPVPLKKTAENAITLRDTFDFDYQEQIRSVKMLMDTFGISSEKAYNLIAQGAQQGLNKNGDLLDSINEYSVHYKQMGASADEFFNSLSNGSKAGTFSVDKLGDAYKEFGIRVKDTNTTTTQGYQLLELNGDSMRKKFAEGGDAAKAATNEVLSALFNMTDQVKQNQAGVDLFGTMWEDLGIKGIKALTNLNGGISSTTNAMKSIQSIKYDDTTNQLTQLARTIQIKIAEPLEKKYLPAVNHGLEVVGDNLDVVTTGMIGLGTAIMVFKISKSEIFLNIAASIQKMTAATEGATVATKALALAQEMTPIGWIMTAIGLLTGGIMAYQAATGDAKDETDSFIDSLKSQEEEINNNLKTYKDSISNVDSEWAANKKLVDKLYELNDVQGKTTGQKAEMKAIVDQLSEDIPELAAAYDSETGSLNMTKDALDQIIQKRKEYALAVAAQNSLKDIAQTITDRELEISQATKKLEEAKNKYNELTGGKWGDSEASDGSPLHVSGKSIKVQSQIIELGEQIDQLTSKNKDANAQFEDAENLVQNYSGALNDTTNSISNMSSAETNAANVTSQTTDSQSQAYVAMQQSIASSIDNTISVFDEFNGGTEISAKQVEKNLQSQIDGVNNWSENMKRLGAAAGQGMTQDFYDYLAKMGPQSANLVKTLTDSLDKNTPLFSEICQKWTEAMSMDGPLSAQVASTMSSVQSELDSHRDEVAQHYKSIYDASMQAAEKAMADSSKKNVDTSKQSGKDQADAQGQGMVLGYSTIAQASQGLFDTATAQGITAPGNFHTIGINMVGGLALGIADGKPQVTGTLHTFFDDLLSVSTKKIDSHSPSKVYNKVIGLMMSRGIAVGITSGGKEAAQSMISVCDAIFSAAQTNLDIHSPSRKFKDKVGAQISTGTAFGISAKKGVAIKSAKSLADDVYKSASTWMDAYKKSHVVSLDDEKYFWQKVASTVKKGTDSYKSALQKASNIDSFEKEMKQKMKGAFGVANYTTGTNGEQQIKSAEDYYGEIYQKANQYFENYGVLHDTSLQQEEYYWKMVRSKMDKGTQAYIDATKKLKDVQGKIKEQAAATVASNKEYALSGGALETYKTYYEVSANAEVQYWDTVRKKFKKGTAERIEADQKYYEAKEKYNQKLEDLDNDYFNNCKEVNDKLADNIKDLTDTYNNAVKERSDGIYSSFHLFDQFESTSASGQTLLYNLRTQVAGYADWEQQLSKLGNKNILSKDLLNELSNMGPEASASIHSLNQLSAEELRQYETLWEQKKALAESQAVKDKESLKTETENKIAALRSTAQAELDAYTQTYQQAVAKLNAVIEAPLQNLANQATTIGEDAVAKIVAGIKSGATKKSTKADLKSVNASITSQLTPLADAGAKIGDDTLQGILDGLTNKKKINASAKDMVAALKKAIQVAAEIHSPSRLFKREIGVQIPAGVAAGIDEGTKSVSASGTDMVNQLLSKTKAQIAQQQATLNDYARSINNSVSVRELNNLISVAPVQQVTATVDNSGLATMFGQMMSVMQSGFKEIGNLQVVTDTGTLVGELSTGMSNDFARKTKRLR